MQGRTKSPIIYLEGRARCQGQNRDNTMTNNQIIAKTILEQSVVKCPDCGKRLILAPGKAWVFCPDWYLCEFEMTPQKFIETYQAIPELDDK